MQMAVANISHLAVDLYAIIKHCLLKLDTHWDQNCGKLLRGQHLALDPDNLLW